MPEDHFEGKGVYKHVVEKQSKGIVECLEVHGAELSGELFAALDSAKDSALALLVLYLSLSLSSLTFTEQLNVLALFSLAWVFWKGIRSAHLGFSKLERLHRLLAEEKYEIENNREQERSELCSIYRLKGFEGQLLEEVVDVLMADDNRLLRVMLEEELGLSLESQTHPLKQGLYAALAAFFTLSSLFASLLYLPQVFLPLAFLLSAFSAALAAKLEKNRVLDALVWNLATVLLLVSLVYFSAEIL